MSLTSKLPALGVSRARPALAALAIAMLAACGESTTAPAATETLTPDAPQLALLSGLRTLKFTETCTGQTCTFDASVSSGFSTYRWSWGDGTTGSTQMVTTHTYASPNGTYVLSLTGRTSTGISATVRKMVYCVDGSCF